MSNLIQIRRSTANATVTGLANGELAFTLASNTLWIGSPSDGTAIPIAGARNPGTLTANQALVANSTSGIDKIITANAVITTLWANGSGGSNGQVLVTNGSAIYWGTGTSGTNTQVQFNDSGVANATAGFTFNKVSNTLSVGNTINTSYLYASKDITLPRPDGRIVWTDAGGSNANDMYIDRGTAFGENVIQFSSAASVTNYLRYSDSGLTLFSSIANTFVSVGNTSVNTKINSSSIILGSSLIANTSGVFTTGTVNATSFTIGTSLIANTTNVVFTTGTITANAFYGNGASITSVDAATVGGNSASDLRGHANDMAANAYSNAMADTLSRSNTYTGNNEFSNGTTFSSNVTLSGYFNSNVVPQANVTYNLGSAGLNWATVYANTVNAVSGNFSGNVSISGDLTVSGNLTTINVNSVVVSDPLIYLAGNNTTTDLLDIGFVGQYYSDTLIRNAGLFRDHDDGIFKLFTHLAQDVKANNNIDTSDASYYVATLQAYLNSGALVSNSLTVTITANSSVNVNITANTLSLSSPLLGNSGGTGLSSYSNNDLLVANGTNGFKTLGFNANVGYVLQSNGTAIVYDVLDGGTF